MEPAPLQPWSHRRHLAPRPRSLSSGQRARRLASGSFRMGTDLEPEKAKP